MKDLKGKNALLTGASRGIGALIAEALAEEGTNLALVARSMEKLESMKKKLETLGVKAIAIPADISAEDARRSLIEEATRALGQIDVLVNNAGMVQDIPFVEQPFGKVKDIIELNLIAPLHLTQLTLPQMLSRRSGHIVTMSSMSGKKGIPYRAVYSATKSALIQWNSALSLELRGTGVEVSVVCPSYVSDLGMGEALRRPPRGSGVVPSHKVVSAVISAIKKNKLETLVVALPIKPLMALDALLPGLGNRFLSYTGVDKYQRRISGIDEE